MHNETITFFAILLSSVCLLYLRNTDPKRHSAHRLPAPTHRRHTLLAWLLCLSPSLFLLMFEYYAPLILWFSALTILGWLIALPKPKKRVHPRKT